MIESDNADKTVLQPLLCKTARAVSAPVFLPPDGEGGMQLALDDVLVRDKGLESAVLIELLMWGGEELGNAMAATASGTRAHFYEIPPTSDRSILDEAVLHRELPYYTIKGDTKNTRYWHPPLALSWVPVGGVVLSVQELLLLADHTERVPKAELPLLEGRDARDMWIGNGRNSKIEERAQRRRLRLERLARRGVRIDDGRRLDQLLGVAGDACCGCGSVSGGLGHTHDDLYPEGEQEGGSSSYVEENDLDPLREMREDVLKGDDGCACIQLAPGFANIRSRRVLTVCSPFSKADKEKNGHGFLVAPAARVDKAVGDWVRAYCDTAGLDNDVYIQTLRKWQDSRLLVQPPLPGSAQGLARAGGIMAGEPPAALDEACLRNSLGTVARSLYGRYYVQGQGRRQAAAGVLRGLVEKGNGQAHKQWEDVLRKEVAVAERGGLQEGAAWRVLEAALQVAGKEGRSERKHAQGLSVERELARACKDVAAGAARALTDEDASVRCVALAGLARLGAAHLRGHAFQRLGILPDPPRGRPPHPPLPPAPDPFADSEVVGRRVEAGTFYTRGVRRGCRDSSPLVREAALKEAAALAAAQGWCGRWLAADARMLLSDPCASVRLAAVRTLCQHCRGQPAPRRGAGLDVETLLALQGPPRRSTAVRLQLGVEHVAAFDPRLGQDGGARLFLTIRRYQSGLSPDPAAGTAEEGDGNPPPPPRSPGGSLIHVCPPPPLEHEWHAPLAYPWEELGCTEALRHEGGVCTWEPLDLDVETLLLEGVDSTVFVQCWEVHGKAASREAALAQSEVVAAAAMPVVRLLEVGCVALEPCGARVAFKLRGRGLNLKIPQVDAATLRPLLVLKTHDGRLVRASQGRVVTHDRQPALANGASDSFREDKTKGLRVGDAVDISGVACVLDQLQRCFPVMPLGPFGQKQDSPLPISQLHDEMIQWAGTLNGKVGVITGEDGLSKRVPECSLVMLETGRTHSIPYHHLHLSSWVEWEPVSVSAESLDVWGAPPPPAEGEQTPPLVPLWPSRPCAVQGGVTDHPQASLTTSEAGGLREAGTGYGWVIEVWDSDESGHHRKIGSASLSVDDVVKHLTEKAAKEARDRKAAAERARRAQTHGSGEDTGKAGSRKAEATVAHSAAGGGDAGLELVRDLVGEDGKSFAGQLEVPSSAPPTPPCILPSCSMALRESLV